MTTLAPAPVRRQTCTEHCAGCGAHFHGLGAFDAHRRGGYCQEPAEVVYGSDSKREGEHVLQMWTETGSCDHQKGCWDNGKLVAYTEPVTVWQVAVSEDARERLSELRGKESAAQGALL